MWNGIRGINNTVDVALSPKAFAKFRSAFDNTKTPYRVVIENLQKYISRKWNYLFFYLKEKNYL